MSVSGCVGTGDVEVWVDEHPLAGIEDVKRKFGQNQAPNVFGA